MAISEKDRLAAEVAERYSVFEEALFGDKRRYPLQEFKTFGEAAKLRREDLLRTIGSLPEASEHASHLAMDALSALLKSLRAQSGRVPSGQ